MNRIRKASATALAFLAVTGASLAQTKYKYTPPPPKVSAPRVSAPKASAPRSAPQRSSQPATRSRSNTSSQSRAQVTSQRASSQVQARQQREQAKQQQKQQKALERQQREQAKQQQKQQKALERQQREQAKHQPKHLPEAGNQAASAPHPTPSLSAATAQPHAAASAYSVPENGAVAGKTPGGAMTLTKEGSQAVVGQVNSVRTHMSGINARPLPSGDVTVHPNGHLTLVTASGQQYGVRPNGSISSFRDHETSATFNNRGMVSSIHTPNLSISRSLSGGRIIVSRGPDNSRLVSSGPRSGYVESNIVVGGRTYVQRTAIVNHQVFTSRYVAYNYGGVALSGFVAPFYYSPGFYGWAFNPWAAPIAYDFGWDGDPWYAGPNPYFGVYAVYPSAAFWLTDYMIGQTLSAAYQMHEDAWASKDNDADYAMDAAAGDGANGSDEPEPLQANTTTAISPEVKGAIAEEVTEQIESDKQNAASQAEQAGHDELAGALSQPNHLFLVSSDLDVITDEGQYCGLQAGDVLRVISPPGPNETIVELRVAASKRADCPAGVAVALTLPDLQEMQNAFHSQIESGLGTLLDNEGKYGIPPAPFDAVANKPQSTVDGPAPVTADELTGMLDAQHQQADQAQAQVTASVK